MQASEVKVTRTKEVYSVPEFAKAVGIGLSSAWAEVNARRVGSARVGPGGKRVVVTRDQIDAYIAARLVPVFDAKAAAKKMLSA